MGGWGRADGHIGLYAACCSLQGCCRRPQPPAGCPLIRQQRRRGSLAARPATSAFSMAGAPLVQGGRRGPQGAPASRERSQSSPRCPPRPRAAPGASPWRTRARCGGRGCPWCAGPWRPPQRTGARGRASRPASLLLAACVQPPVRAEAGRQRHLMRWTQSCMLRSPWPEEPLERACRLICSLRGRRSDGLGRAAGPQECSRQSVSLHLFGLRPFAAQTPRAAFTQRHKPGAASSEAPELGAVAAWRSHSLQPASFAAHFCLGCLARCCHCMSSLQRSDPHEALVHRHQHLPSGTAARPGTAMHGSGAMYPRLASA